MMRPGLAIFFSLSLITVVLLLISSSKRGELLPRTNHIEEPVLRKIQLHPGLQQPHRPLVHALQQKGNGGQGEGSRVQALKFPSQRGRQEVHRVQHLAAVQLPLSKRGPDDLHSHFKHHTGHLPNQLNTEDNTATSQENGPATSARQEEQVSKVQEVAVDDEEDEEDDEEVVSPFGKPELSEARRVSLLRSYYGSWMNFLRRGFFVDTSIPFPEKYKTIMNLLLQQGQVELDYFLRHPNEMELIDSTNYLSSTPIIKMMGLGSVKFYFGLMAMYGEVLHRKVYLPDLPVSARSSERKPASYIYDLSEMNSEAEKRENKVRFVEELPQTIENLFNLSVPILDLKRGQIFTFSDDEVFLLLAQSKSVVLQVPFWFCDSATQASKNLRMSMQALFVFSREVAQQGDRIKQELLHRGDYTAVHLRHEPQYDAFCYVYKKGIGENNNFCMNEGLGFSELFVLNVSTCYVQSADLAERLQEKSLPKVVYLAGGYGVDEPETHSLFRPLDVYSKASFLNHSFASNDDLDFFWTAVDYYVSKEAEVFVGTGWSAFSWTIATERFVKHRGRTLDYTLADLCPPSTSYCSYRCLAYWLHCGHIDEQFLEKANAVVAKMIVKEQMVEESLLKEEIDVLDQHLDIEENLMVGGITPKKPQTIVFSNRL